LTEEGGGRFASGVVLVLQNPDGRVYVKYVCPRADGSCSPLLSSSSFPHNPQHLDYEHDETLLWAALYLEHLLTSPTPLHLSDDVRARVRAAGTLADFIAAGQCAAMSAAAAPSIRAFVPAAAFAPADAPVSQKLTDSTPPLLPPSCAADEAAEIEEDLTASARALRLNPLLPGAARVPSSSSTAVLSTLPPPPPPANFRPLLFDAARMPSAHGRESHAAFADRGAPSATI
jgi:hypothetical protein